MREMKSNEMLLEDSEDIFDDDEDGESGQGNDYRSDSKGITSQTSGRGI